MLQRPTTNGLAVTSMILGILGILCLWILTGIPAIICGHIALSQISKSGGRQTGTGMAIAGLILGYLVSGLTLIAFLFSLFIG